MLVSGGVRGHRSSDSTARSFSPLSSARRLHLIYFHLICNWTVTKFEREEFHLHNTQAKLPGNLLEGLESSKDNLHFHLMLKLTETCLLIRSSTDRLAVQSRSNLVKCCVPNADSTLYWVSVTLNMTVQGASARM